MRGDGAIETTDRSEAALYVCVGVTVVRESAGPTKQAERQSRPAPARSSSSTVEWRRQWRCDPSQRRQKDNGPLAESEGVAGEDLEQQLVGEERPLRRLVTSQSSHLERLHHRLHEEQERRR